MLLWETLTKEKGSEASNETNGVKRATRSQRLPFDNRCAALTRSGKRCRCRIRKGSDFCQFHNPEVSEERRRRNAAKGGRNSHKLSHIPGGYLRKLTDQRGLGQAMDRLYREVRLGIITPEMGKVLFDILTRIMDNGLCDSSNGAKPLSTRSKAHSLRPKVSEALTRAEKVAWRKAVENTPIDLPSVDLQERQATPIHEQGHSLSEQDIQTDWSQRPERRLKLQAV